MRRLTRNIILLAVALLVVIISKYSTMANMQESYTEQWDNVENQYQNKIHIIPKMLATIKGYTEDEAILVEGVKSARLAAAKIDVDANNLSAAELEKYQAAQAMLSSAILSFYDLIEQNSEFQSNQKFLDLQAELAGIDNRTLVERRRFNTQVELYNDYLDRFPNNLVAGLIQFKKQAMIEVY